MPQVRIVYYQEDGWSPVLEWLDDLSGQDRDAFAKCRARIGALSEQGHEARRPLCENLGDGIYELRIRKGRVNYRILYFFHERAAAVLACACTKEAEVPTIEIEHAKERRDRFKAAPDRHSHREVQQNKTHHTEPGDHGS